MKKKVEILQRLRPFTHDPGKKIILPGSSFICQIFPTAIYFFEAFAEKPSVSLYWQLEGFFDFFTAELDLENLSIRVWMISQKNRYQYRLSLEQDMAIGLSLEKSPISNIEIVLEKNKGSKKEILTKGKKNIFEVEKKIENTEKSLDLFQKKTRLSLGSHKSQDLSGICRRRDLKEIFPIWYQLALCQKKLIDTRSTLTIEETVAIEQAFSSQRHDLLYTLFLHWFLKAFEEYFIPQPYNNQYYVKKDFSSENAKTIVDWAILIQGGRYIERCFIERKEKTIALLPHLLPQFPCGRMVNVPVDLGLVDFEWQKKELIRVLIHIKKEGLVQLQLPRSITKMRMAYSPYQKGIVVNSREVIHCKQNQTIYLDRLT